MTFTIYQTLFSYRYYYNLSYKTAYFETHVTLSTTGNSTDECRNTSVLSADQG